MVGLLVVLLRSERVGAEMPQSQKILMMKRSKKVLFQPMGKWLFIGHFKKALEKVGIEAVIVGYSGEAVCYTYAITEKEHEHFYYRLLIEDENGNKTAERKRASEVRHVVFTNRIEEVLHLLPNKWRTRVQERQQSLSLLPNASESQDARYSHLQTSATIHQNLSTQEFEESSATVHPLSAQQLAERRRARRRMGT